MRWNELPFRTEDPCNQSIEYFDYQIPFSDLTDCLNALSRQGFNNIDYTIPEVDTYQEKVVRITAERVVCVCKRKVSYIHVDFPDLLP